MKSKARLAALAVALILSACSGEESPGGDGGRGEPAAAGLVAQLRRLAAAPAARAAVPTAEQLFEFAERSYPQFLPGPAATQTLAPFAYRYYPATGIYLAVVVAAGTPYPVDGVYVMGGPFGDAPTYVGQLSAIVPASGPETARGCYDLALQDTEGTEFGLSYAVRGPAASTITLGIRVGDVVTFEGHEARETVFQTRVERPEATVEFTRRSYERRTGEDEVTEFGSTESVTGSTPGHTLTILTTEVWDPPAIDRRHGLATGQSIGIGYDGTNTQIMFVDGVRQPAEVTPQSLRRTVTFVGRESITVPAGTYQTCRFDTVNGPGDTITEWILDGVGVPVKSVATSAGETETVEALSVSVNGRVR